MGWCFPKKDLEILDDPIPEELYCGRRCKPCHEGSEIEKGLNSSDDGLEEVDGNGASMLPSEGESHINITQEMDRCDLWKHMVHNLESEPSLSINGKKENGGVKCRANLNERFDKELLNSSEPGKSLLYQSTEV